MIHCIDFWEIRNLTLLSAGHAHFSNVHYDKWNPEIYLSKNGRMKVLQYGTGCAVECSEVTKSTVPYLLKHPALLLLYSQIGWIFKSKAN